MDSSRYRKAFRHSATRPCVRTRFIRTTRFFAAVSVSFQRPPRKTGWVPAFNAVNNFNSKSFRAACDSSPEYHTPLRVDALQEAFRTPSTYNWILSADKLLRRYARLPPIDFTNVSFISHRPTVPDYKALELQLRENIARRLISSRLHRSPAQKKTWGCQDRGELFRLCQGVMRALQRLRHWRLWPIGRKTSAYIPLAAEPFGLRLGSM